MVPSDASPAGRNAAKATIAATAAARSGRRCFHTSVGSDPLFSDEENTMPGRFDTRIEVYSPPYLFAGDRPEVTEAPEEITRGSTLTIATDGAEVAWARLLRPSAVTHQTDPEQRSIALDVRSTGPGAHDLSVLEQAGLTPSGWYMLVVLDDDGVPSPARWVHVR